MATHNTNHVSNAAVLNNSKMVLTRAPETSRTTGIKLGSFEALQTVYPPALLAGWTQGGTNPTRIENAGGLSTYSVGGKQRKYTFQSTPAEIATGGTRTDVFDRYGRRLTASGGNISVAAFTSNVITLNSDTSPGNNSYTTDKTRTTYYTKVGSLVSAKTKA